jgi:hypothetical protein
LFKIYSNIKIRQLLLLLFLIISVISCSSADETVVPPTTTGSPTLAPTNTVIPTKTATLVPTNTPTSTYTPTATEDPCPQLDIFVIEGLDGLKGEIFLLLEESYFEQVALYNEANGTDLVPRSLIETFGECEAPEGDFQVVPLLNSWGTLSGQYFVLDKYGYCLLESGCDVAFTIYDYAQLGPPDARVGEAGLVWHGKVTQLGGVIILGRFEQDNLISYEKWMNRSNWHAEDPNVHLFVYLMDSEFRAEEVLYLVTRINLKYPYP